MIEGFGLDNLIAQGKHRVKKIAKKKNESCGRPSATELFSVQNDPLESQFKTRKTRKVNNNLTDERTVNRTTPDAGVQFV